jgi:hypothetical protein
MDESSVEDPLAETSAQGPGGAGKAFLGAIAAVVLAALAFLWIPHWILAVLPFGSRALRVGLATTWVGGVFVFTSWLTWRSSAPVAVLDPGPGPEAAPRANAKATPGVAPDPPP